MANIFDLINEKKNNLRGFNETIKPQDGNNLYVFLPSWNPNEKKFWADLGRHYVKNAMGEIQAVCACDYVYGKRCDVCEAIAKAKNEIGDTDPVTLKALEEAGASHKVLFNVLEVKNGKPAADDVKVLEVTKGTAADIFNVMSSLQAQGVQELFDFTNGLFIINVIKSGKGRMGTKYSPQLALQRVSYSPDEVEIIKGSLKDLDIMVTDKEENKGKALTSLSATLGVNLLAAPAQAPAMISAQPQNFANTGFVNQGFAQPQAQPQANYGFIQPQAQAVQQDLNTMLGDSIPSFESNNVEVKETSAQDLEKMLAGI